MSATFAKYSKWNGRFGKNAEGTIGIPKTITAIFTKSVRGLFIFKRIFTSSRYVFITVCFFFAIDAFLMFSTNIFINILSTKFLAQNVTSFFSPFDLLAFRSVSTIFWNIAYKSFKVVDTQNMLLERNHIKILWMQHKYTFLKRGCLD